MSAFIVSFNTIRDCVALLRDPYDRLETCNQLGKTLLEMNNGAVYRAYAHRDDVANMLLEESEIESFQHDESSFRDTHTLARKCQIYKSVQCFLYQCNESKIPDQWVVWQKLDKLKTELAKRLIDEMPEYNRAEWCRR